MIKKTIFSLAFFVASIFTQAQVNYLKNNTPVLPQAMQGCGYSNFETGQAFGWTTESGNINSVNLPCDTCAKKIGGISQIVNHTSTVAGICNNGVDYYGGFPIIEPTYGGSYSMLLNNVSAGGKMQRAFFTFVVDNSASMFIVQFAAVLQSGGHPLNQQPYFEVKLIDSTANSIIPCSNYLENAPSSGNLPGWNNSTVDATVYYKNWTTSVFYLSSLVGHKLTLQYIVSDCDQGGHFGYAYIDANCVNGGPQITSSKNLCVAGDTTILSGPVGYSTYSWAGPVTANTQTLATTMPGSYTLTTSSLSGCSSPILYYNVTQGVFNTLSVAAKNDSICAGGLDTLVASGASTYTWSTNSISNTIAVMPFTNTTYTLIGTDAHGCNDTITKTIKTINCTTGINQILGSNEQVTIYPNPANDMLYINCKQKNATLFITDVIGNKIKQLSIENDITSFDISSLSKGVYFLNVKTAESFITKKFIVQH